MYNKKMYYANFVEFYSLNIDNERNMIFGK